jgi:ABC-type Fe3+-hydroxamate transport system substrate-binding protein
MTSNVNAVAGNGHRGKALIFDHPPERVISLVPSLTESIFDLGLGASVVGITDYCVHPASALKDLPRIGGPKTPRVEDILKLKPELVAANMEENPLETVEALEAQGIKVWVTFPQTIRHALDVLWLLVGLYKSRTAAIRLETLELTVEWAESALEDRKPFRYFCPIWQDESGWMTINHQTYVNDVLRLMGGENVFAGRNYHSPLGKNSTSEIKTSVNSPTIRYPRVNYNDLREAAPEVIILPSEPYAFGEAEKNQFVELLPDIPAVQHSRIYPIDGSLITWHGTRLARALRDLPHLFR